MGQSQSLHQDDTEKFKRFSKDYKLTAKKHHDVYGDVYYGKSTEGLERHILIKDTMCRDQEDLMNLTRFLKMRMEFKHENLCEMRDAFVFADSSFCGAGHRIKIAFEFHPLTLESEIIRRQKITKLDNDHEEKVLFSLHIDSYPFTQAALARK